jgi:CheY-like chemotaxis protein
MAREETQSAPELPHGNERIMIVDDEKDLLVFAQSTLGGLGYAVDVASDAKKALQKLDDGRPTDLLFTDVVMPGDMNGFDLARKATQLYPGIKILMASGFTQVRKDTEKDGNLGKGLLIKPYRREELAHRIRQVLDGPV